MLSLPFIMSEMTITLS